MKVYVILLSSFFTSFISFAQDLTNKLPTTAIPASNNDAAPLAIIISGDGGWTDWDQSLAENLAKKEIPSVGLDAQKYFWNKKSPATCAIEISNLVNNYSALWKKKKFILIGFSFGADVVPFIVNHFSNEMKNKLQGLILLSPDPKADFEIHIADMLNIGSSSDTYDVVAEVKKMEGSKTICVFGNKENANSLNLFKHSGSLTKTLSGDHHFNDNFKEITELIIRQIYSTG